MVSTKTFAIASVAIKVVLMVLITIAFIIGCYAIFGSDAKKYLYNAPAFTKKQYEPSIHKEYGFLALAFPAVLFTLGSSILIRVSFSSSEANNSTGFIVADILLCTCAALFALAAGVLLILAAAAECDFKQKYSDSRTLTDRGVKGDIMKADLERYFAEDGTSGRGAVGRSGGRSSSDDGDKYECRTSMTLAECRKKICSELWMTSPKSAAAILAIIVGAAGFWVPCALAFKVHNKNPQEPGTSGGVVTGPQVNPSESAPDNYQRQNGGAQSPGGDPPQMSPSQNPPGGYLQGGQ